MLFLLSRLITCSGQGHRRDLNSLPNLPTSPVALNSILFCLNFHSIPIRVYTLCFKLFSSKYASYLFLFFFQTLPSKPTSYSELQFPNWKFVITVFAVGRWNKHIKYSQIVRDGRAISQVVSLRLLAADGRVIGLKQGINN